MIVLGIEGSANKLAVGIVKDEQILSNIRRTYVPPAGEGFIPMKAAEHHRENIIPLILNLCRNRSLLYMTSTA